MRVILSRMTIASRVTRAVLLAGSLAAEVLIALAWRWRPDDRMAWAILAAGVLIIAVIVDHGTRR